MLHELKRHKTRQAAQRLRLGGEWCRPGLMFTSRTGDVLNASMPEQNLRRLCRRLGLPALTVHGLRHLHASLLLAQGLPIPLVSQRLGHTSPAITMGVYAHCVAREQDQVAQAMSAILRGRWCKKAEAYVGKTLKKASRPFYRVQGGHKSKLV